MAAHEAPAPWAAATARGASCATSACGSGTGAKVATEALEVADEALNDQTSFQIGSNTTEEGLWTAQENF